MYSLFQDVNQSLIISTIEKAFFMYKSTGLCSASATSMAVRSIGVAPKNGNSSE